MVEDAASPSGIARAEVVRGWCRETFGHGSMLHEAHPAVTLELLVSCTAEGSGAIDDVSVATGLHKASWGLAMAIEEAAAAAAAEAEAAAAAGAEQA